MNYTGHAVRVLNTCDNGRGGVCVAITNKQGASCSKGARPSVKTKLKIKLKLVILTDKLTNGGTH